MGIFQKIKQQLKDNDVRTLLENFISLSALQLIGIILPFLTLPYVLNVIGFEKYGIIVFAGSLIAYFNSLTDFSFRITGVREVALNRNNLEELNIIYSKILLIKSFFLIVSLIIIGCVVLLYPPFYVESNVYFYSALMLIGYTLFPEWFFQGIEKMRYITYLNLGIKVFFTLCVFIFIQEKEDYWVYPLLQSAGFIGAGVVGQIILIKKYKLKFSILSFSLIRQTIKSNLPVFINQFVPTLFNNTTTFLMGFLLNASSLAVFDVVRKVVMLKGTLINILGRVFFPFLNRNKDKFRIYAKYNIIGFLIIFICMLLIYPIIRWIFKVEDENGFLIYLILCIGMLFVGIESVFGLNFLFVNGYDKLIMKITVIASLIGLFSAYPFIVSYGVIGGALNIMICQILMGLFTYIYYKKISS